MEVFGWLLIVLALPLLIGYGISEKKSKMWLRLGLVMSIVGFAIIVIGAVTG